MFIIMKNKKFIISLLISVITIIVVFFLKIKTIDNLCTLKSIISLLFGFLVSFSIFFFCLKYYGKKITKPNND